MEIQGATALVTGSNRGIGRAIADELSSRGAEVLSGVRLLDAEHESGAPTGTTPVRIDLSSPDAVETSVRDLAGEAQRIDLLVNNAGEWIGGLFERQDPAQINAVIQANLAGPIHLTRLLLPHMLERGSGMIVDNASIVGHAPFPGATTYAASKTGMHGFTESLRRELHDTGVHVMEVVTPGVDTDMMDQVQRDLQPHVDTDGWDHVEPEGWAEKVADAIESDKDQLNPGVPERIAQLLPAALLEAGSKRAFKR
jgi:short-subunit dehydrogenase